VPICAALRQNRNTQLVMNSPVGPHSTAGSVLKIQLAISSIAGRLCIFRLCPFLTENTMKIAQIAPLYEAVPPRLYGGTERIVADLTDALVDLGHQVTLFSAGRSETRAHHISARDKPLRLDPEVFTSDLASHLNMLHEVNRRADEFDVIHFHIDLLHFPFFENKAERTLTTLHGRLDITRICQGPICVGTAFRWSRFPTINANPCPLPIGKGTSRTASQ
jgi:hypothetical protein